MRLLCFLILLAVGAVVVAFAFQNQQMITLTFFDYGITASVAAIVGAVYVLGMVSGWTVVGMVRRSFERVTEFPERSEYARSR